MKTICLVRHAKSSKSIPGIRDIDRPLNEKGYREAYLVGEKLAEKSFKPQLLISSPAIRAFNTALVFAGRLSYPEEKIILKKDLYETSPEDYINEIMQTENAINSLMLFGHNPLISTVLSKLIKKNYQDMETSAAAAINFNVKAWKDIAGMKGELLFHISPKNLEG
jgi:phosphohistidine phosphatase